MSILTAILASRSGLQANSQRAQLVSTNIAHAQDENYSHRSLEVTEALGGGVRVIGVARAMDTAMDALYRTEMSFAAKQDAMATTLGVYGAELGELDTETSIPNLLSAFQNDLGLLSNDPGDASLQQEVYLSAKALTGAIRSANSALNTVETTAVNGIGNDISAANEALRELARINADIGKTEQGTETYAALEDRRAAELDKLANIVQIQVSYDTDGRANVHAAGGQSLVVAGHVNEFSFDRPTGTLYSGDQDVTPGVAGRRGAEQGSLSGYVTLLNDVVPQQRLELDEIARGLIQGFEDADTSLAPGQAGLFTNGGMALGSPVTPGLAGRIAVNDAIDPFRGGDLSLLRDGIGAVTTGAASDNTQVLAFLDFFDTQVAFDPAAGQGATGTIMDFTTGAISQQQARRVDAESNLNSLIASSETYRAARLNARGVNIDTELQNLSLIEQSYNANSQALRVASEMIDTLLNMF
ncbi:flagellar hook-associated protein [Pseudooceanicola batsensis HTCC2597]|uniref:Flagellar hook-associated protein 1 n=1 Tax=Pseudooceanicola batsensis (strain ATCC BAA-863 / DSM 15984 / KCTC 12145 / HTCC2597) TaxID=252305 RepID=A3U101_PSEBH|nr:flagellar hook-associated protein FlgK [Pseudooceanicola batsensis]EAQ01984.1 flagellar hook-associated protein [Pseudooceanicola batsensis HTCC2597]